LLCHLYQGHAGSSSSLILSSPLSLLSSSPRTRVTLAHPSSLSSSLTPLSSLSFLLLSSPSLLPLSSDTRVRWAPPSPFSSFLTSLPPSLFRYQGHVGSSLIVGGFKPNMELKKAEHLVRDAIAAGIFCDLRSGSNVDLCVIMEKGVEMKRGYEIAAKRGEGDYRYKRGTSAVLTKTITPLSLELVEESIQTMDQD
uniref:Proteasome beta subunit C-terminal domain-containing protein n=1 Tax=Periophthalmus magnuspinnatus TaxID=409849 RepID=A0A3B4AZN5_9GOBI